MILILSFRKENNVDYYVSDGQADNLLTPYKHQFWYLCNHFTCTFETFETVHLISVSIICMEDLTNVLLWYLLLS